MSFAMVGRVWTREAFRAYLKTVENAQDFRAVCVHHTAAPSLAQRPQGFKAQHIENMASFYRGKGWSAGPHLFTDEDQAWGMTPVSSRGVHAASFNGRAVGIEMLGDYDTEDPKSGRGLQVVTFTAGIVAELLAWMELEPTTQTVLFHRDDPKTSKTCPGVKVQKDWFVSLVKAAREPKPVEPPKWRVEEGELITTGYEVGGRVCVALGAFLGQRGVSGETVASNLHRKDGAYFYGAEELEGAYFDKAIGATFAPVREVAPLVGRRIVSASGGVVVVGKV